MASISATCVRFQLPLKPPSKIKQLTRRCSSLKFFSAGLPQGGFHVLRTSYLRVSCAAKPETVEKVCEIVRKQLALPPESALTPESQLSALGADSLDTVEIVMGLEEEFGISVEEDKSQNITTIQEAADLIEMLIGKQS